MKIGIYGGSFNPIHFGHIGLAKWVIANTDLDEVWLMVSPSNPLKDKNILIDETIRLNAAKEATSDITGIVVSDFEFHLPRPSYTANTLRELTLKYPQHEFTVIIGEDNLDIFHKWRDYQYILNHYRIFVYPRRHCNTNQVLVSDSIKILRDAPYFDISSTEIRSNQRKIN